MLDCLTTNELGENKVQRCPRIITAETVEVFAREFRDDNSNELEKAANDDTFQYNRFGHKNAYMFFALRIFYDSFNIINLMEYKQDKEATDSPVASTSTDANVSLNLIHFELIQNFNQILFSILKNTTYLQAKTQAN